MPKGIYQRTKEMYFTRLGNKNRLGKHLSEEHKQKISVQFKKLWQNPEFLNKMKRRNKKLSEILKGNKAWNWKGENVKYKPLHTWLRRWNLKPLFCEECKKQKRLTIANITGIYNRDFSNYGWLCYSCHNKLDWKYRKNRNI